MKEISIIVPIYNMEKKLGRCIKSILKQSFKNFELILVNDGSTDNSIKICKNYAKKDNRIVIIDKENEGVIKTRQRGVDESKGKYITFVDSDDYVHEKMLEKLYNEIINNSCDIVVCDYYKTIGKIKKGYKNKYFENEKLYDEYEIKSKLIASYLCGDGFPSSLYGKLYKRELFDNIGEYSKNIIFFGDDLATNLEVFVKARKVKVIKDRLYYYAYGGNTSRYMDCIFDDLIETFKIQKDIIKRYFNSNQEKYLRSSFMLLNSYKYSLENLLNSNLNSKQIEDKIIKYAKNEEIIQACEMLKNNEMGTWFNDDYFIEAIENKDIDYLISIGTNIHNKLRYKRMVINILLKIS